MRTSTASLLALFAATAATVASGTPLPPAAQPTLPPSPLPKDRECYFNYHGTPLKVPGTDPCLRERARARAREERNLSRYITNYFDLYNHINNDPLVVIHEDDLTCVTKLPPLPKKLLDKYKSGKLSTEKKAQVKRLIQLYEKIARICDSTKQSKQGSYPNTASSQKTRKSANRGYTL